MPRAWSTFCLACVDVVPAGRATRAADPAWTPIDEKALRLYFACEMPGEPERTVRSDSAGAVTGVNNKLELDDRGLLLALSRRADLACFRKHRRRPKKPRSPRTRYKRKPHVSTARIREASRGRKLSLL